MYNEVFFAYKEELNDPLDLTIDYQIKKKEKYVLQFFIEAAIAYYSIDKRVTDNDQKFSKELAGRLIVTNIYTEWILLKGNLPVIETVFNEYYDRAKFPAFIRALKNTFDNQKKPILLACHFQKNHLDLICCIYRYYPGKS